MSIRARKNIFLIISLLIMAFIFIQSALPADISSAESGPFALFLAGLFKIDTDSADFLIRKAGHFTEYAVLGISLLFTVKAWMEHFRTAASRLYQAGLAAFVIGVLYAVSDEIHQIFVEGRSCEFRDVCIDAAGVALGIVIGLLILKKRSKSSRKAVSGKS